jgi:hypothetical protein
MALYWYIHPPFLDINYSWPIISLGHEIHWKLTHSKLCKPPCKQTGHKSPWWSGPLSGKTYSQKQICWALNLPVRTTRPSEKLSSVTFLLSKWPSSRLARHNIKKHWTAFQDCQLPLCCGKAEDPRCIQHPLLMWAGLHWTDMLVHWGQGDRIPQTHLAWTTCQVSSGHAQMHPWPSTSKSTIKPYYMDWPSGRWFETKLHPNNINVENGLIISGSYKSLIHSLRECRRPPKMVK